MAKTSKKALGATMAGVMALGAVAGTVGALDQVKVANAAESQAQKDAKAKISHTIYSINKNYAGIKNQAQWEIYIKDARALIAKMPAAEKEVAAELTKQVDGLADTVLAIARINQVEKSYEANFHGIKNAAQWREYLDLAKEDMKSVDQTVFAAKYEELVKRYNVASDNVKAIEDAYAVELADATKLYDAAVKSMNLADAEKALKAAEALGTHATSDKLEADCKALIAQINDKIAVQSVEVLNLKEIKVSFNKPANIDNMNVSITSVGSAVASGNITAKLSADKKAVILTTTNNLTKDGFYNVAISNVVDRDTKEPMKPFASSIKIEDKVAPTIKEVKAVTTSTTTRSITVEFSEPVTFGLVKIGDEIATASDMGGQKKWTFTLANLSAKALEVGKTYELSIAGLADLAGNYAENPLKQSVTIVRDEVKPQFSIKSVSPKEFDLVFDKEMDANVAYDAIIVKDSSDKVLSQANLAVRDKDDKKVFHVTLATSPIEEGKTSAEVSVTVKSMKDTVGNEVSQRTEKVTLSKDTVKPDMNSVRIIPGSNNKIEVAFSKKVTDVQASDFILTNSKGEVVALTQETLTVDSDNRVVLTTVNPLANDTYNLALKVNSVVDASGNKNDAKAIKVTYNSAVAPQLNAEILGDKDLDGTADLATDSQIVTVKFSQADVVNGLDDVTGNYKAGAAENPSNYTINGATLPEGTKVTFTDNATISGKTVDYVKIDFTNVADKNKVDALKEGGKLTLTASNVKTEAGATLSYTSAALDVVDHKAPTIKSAFVVGNSTDGYKLELVFSEKMGAVAVADLSLTDGSGTATLGNATIGSDRTKVTIAITSLGGLDKSNAVIKVTGVTGTEDMASTPNKIVVDNKGVSVIDYSAVPGAPAATSYTIDYTAEKTGESIPATVEYSTDGGSNWTAGTDAKVAVTPGKDMKFRVKAAGSTPAGEIQNLVVSVRPSAPTGLVGDTSKVTGATAGLNYESSTDGTTFTAATLSGTEITGLTAGKVYIRLAATATAFASTAAEVTVK